MYHCLSKSGSTDWEVTPLQCHTLQTRSKIHNNTLIRLESKQEIIRIHLHPSAIINNTRPAKCLLNLTQPPEPLRVTNNVKCDIPATSRNTNLQLLSIDIYIKYTEDSWNEVPKTGSKVNVVSHLCHISPVAPPSHTFRPVASVPSLGGRDRLYPSPRRRRPRPAAPRPPPGGR